MTQTTARRPTSAGRLSPEDIADLVDVENGTVCSSIFSDPDIYALEIEQVFGKSWQLLGHETQIPKMGDFVLSSLGADSVIMQRSAKGEIAVMLNQCRHRGSQLCRADVGNSKSWVCPYHGWVYDSKGSLVNVPRESEGYQGRLKKEDWGLIRARVATYRGWVFANWDHDGADLEDSLGDARYYLDHYFNLNEAGPQIVSMSRWVVSNNWKLLADQHVWDAYHANVSHASAIASLTPEGVPVPTLRNLMDTPSPGVLWSEPKHGHGGLLALRGYGDGDGGAVLDGGEDFDALSLDPYSDPELKQYMVELKKKSAERVGDFRSKKVSLAVMCLFPNLGINDVRYIRTWVPLSPSKTEVRNYVFMEADAPDALKAAMADSANRQFGSAGVFEQDDVDNIRMCQIGLSGGRARHTRLNMQMGLGRKVDNPFGSDAPGLVSESTYNEQGARNFYRRWQEMLMQGVPAK